jgi:hypothetical protein
MDAYGQIGPDKPGYDDDLAAIARRLADGEAVAFTHSHRMTALDLVVVPAQAISAHTVESPFRVHDGDVPLVAVLGKGSSRLPLLGDLDSEAVDEYLGVTNRVDATGIADLLNRLADAMRPVRAGVR